MLLRSNINQKGVITMAKTVAERQATYRLRRNDGEGDRRLNTWVSCKTHFALNRLAKSYGVTQREMCERLISDADDSILRSIELDTPEWDNYMNVTA
jgi:hypothetical protein